MPENQNANSKNPRSNGDGGPRNSAGAASPSAAAGAIENSTKGGGPNQKSLAINPAGNSGKPLNSGAKGIQDQKKDDPRARAAFVNHLLTLRGEEVSAELKLDSTQSLLFTHRVAVIDDKGEKNGPVQEALKWLIFNHDKQKLVQMTEK